MGFERSGAVDEMCTLIGLAPYRSRRARAEEEEEEEDVPRRSGGEGAAGPSRRSRPPSGDAAGPSRRSRPPSGGEGALVGSSGRKKARFSGGRAGEVSASKSRAVKAEPMDADADDEEEEEEAREEEEDEEEEENVSYGGGWRRPLHVEYRRGNSRA